MRNEADAIELAVISALRGGAGTVIVSDNASTDSSSDVVKRLQLQDSRVKLIELEDNLGPWRNFSLVLSLSSSPYFAWLGSHDTVAPDYYEILLRQLRSSDAGLAFGIYADQPDHYDANDASALANTDPVIRVQRLMQKPQDGAMIHGVFSSERLKIAVARHPGLEVFDGSLLLEYLRTDTALFCAEALYYRSLTKTDLSTPRRWVKQYRRAKECQVAYPRHFIPQREMYRSIRHSYGQSVKAPNWLVNRKYSLTGVMIGSAVKKLRSVCGRLGMRESVRDLR